MSKDILVIEDDEVLNKLITEHLEHMGYAAHSAITWSDAEKYFHNEEPDLVLMDMRLPDTNGMDMLPRLTVEHPVIVVTAYGSVKDAVQTMKFGATDYLVKPFNLDELEVVVKRALENAALKADHNFFKQRIQAHDSKKLMVGQSSAIQEVHNLIDAVAATDMTVLIQGESGVGKELVARTIHNRSHRGKRHFVAVDCCTLHEKLFESELFGHERGAFTGADRQKKGLIEGAEGGTLFLDEIGEINLAMQAKLLRVMETGMFRRVGGTKDLHANVRVVAATNRNLEAVGHKESFRRDLFFRISAFVITVPPLRDRREDIPDLVSHFIRNHDFSRRIEKTASEKAMRILTAYDWPGNIRELKNAIERAIILSGDKRKIRQEHLAACLSNVDSELSVTLSFDHTPTLEEMERDYLSLLLKKHSGHRSMVAKTMGVSERNIYRLIEKYRLKNPEFH